MLKNSGNLLVIDRQSWFALSIQFQTDTNFEGNGRSK